MAAAPDPSRTSHYVTDTFYQALVEDFSDWQRDDRAIADPAIREACRAFLEREARLLDRHLYDDWLSLFTPECLYWVPATPEGGDPRKEVAVCLDDRRRLEDRIFRLTTGAAWSQVPVSRTVRMVSNVEPFATEHDDILMVRSNLMINEFRPEDLRILAGWCGHRLRRAAKGFEILVKQVNLIQCDQNLRNPSVII
ncbi:MAG TPA: aromatic-ring-hydroxylating dioxygenase subunit beta [Alphaproteobacteria bacterium]|nr:aromatic-ring-hydroxylating dioxygenase subunit beta [Alphaproteobacteria bacterium]